MTHSVQREPRDALAINDPTREHQRLENAIVYVGVRLDVAHAVREHKIEMTFRTNGLPSLEHFCKPRPHRDFTSASFAFGIAHLTVAIGALAHRDDAALEVDSVPR